MADQVLHHDRIPIWRVWDVAMLFHAALRHPLPWADCEEGCHFLADEAVRALFGHEPNQERIKEVLTGTWHEQDGA